MKKVLLTTPDYPPKLGGLSTFTVNIESTLNDMGIEIERLVWTSINDLKDKSKKKFQDEKIYDAIINIHFMGGFFLDEMNCKHINFVHGSEILFYSPNIIKKYIKLILKKKLLKYIESSHANFYISDFTLKKLQETGYQPNFSKDFILHNGIAINLKEKPCINSIEEDFLDIVCIARDVPHKNLAGCLTFCELLSKVSNKKINFYSTSKSTQTSDLVKCLNIQNITDDKREDLYRKCHFNILLSLDYSHIGFYEGFGLTVLEAGKYGTPSIVSGSGGLSESVHDSTTGWVLNEIDEHEVQSLWDKISKTSNYKDVAKSCFQHTRASHSLAVYKKILKRFI